MMGLSFPHLLLAGAVILLLFGGKGKVSDLMGDFAKGIKSFKKGLADDEDAAAERKVATPVAGIGADPVKTIDHRATVVVDDPAQQRRAG